MAVIVSDFLITIFAGYYRVYKEDLQVFSQVAVPFMAVVYIVACLSLLLL